MRAKIDPELIEELGITNIQPTKRHNGGINGVGNISCSGYIGPQRVKIYTTYRDDLPALREEIETKQFITNVRFPPLVATRGRFVVEHWIDGPNLSQVPTSSVKKLVPTMVEFLLEFKTITIDHVSSYDHLQCFLSSVEERKDNPELVAKWKKEYSKQPAISKHLRHGDLHEANIILNDNTMYIIDNDGVSYDNGWFMSWRKSFLYSTRFKIPPFTEIYKNADELELDYYDNISMKFVRTSHMLRNAYFGRLNQQQFLVKYQRLFGKIKQDI